MAGLPEVDGAHVARLAPISFGVPSAKTAPPTSTVMRSAKRNTRSMS